MSGQYDEYSSVRFISFSAMIYDPMPVCVHGIKRKSQLVEFLRALDTGDWNLEPGDREKTNNCSRVESRPQKYIKS